MHEHTQGPKIVLKLSGGHSIYVAPNPDLADDIHEARGEDAPYFVVQDHPEISVDPNEVVAVINRLH